MQMIEEEPVRKRQRRNAIRPYSEETRMIQAVADEYHLRTTLDLIHLFPVAAPNLENLNSSLNEHRDFDHHHPHNQPVLTTAMYADSEFVPDSSVVLIVDESSYVSSEIGPSLSNIFPVADPISEQVHEPDIAVAREGEGEDGEDEDEDEEEENEGVEI